MFPNSRALPLCLLFFLNAAFAFAPDTFSLRQTATFKGHKALINCLAFSPDGRLLASGSRDHGIFLWNLKSGRRKAVLAGHSASVNALAFSPDNRVLFSGSD